MTAAASPATSIARRARWSSGASGVVACASLAAWTPPIRVSAVPVIPVRIPAASRAAVARNDVVVLPSVPVIPTTASSALGSRYHHAAAVASAARVSSTTSCGRSLSGSARSTSAADAPARGRRSHEVVPVGVQPGHRHEERAGANVARVVGDAADRDRRQAGRPDRPAVATGAAQAALRGQARDQPAELDRLGQVGGREKLGDGRLGHRPISAGGAAGQAADPVAARVEDAFVGAGQLQPLPAERLLVLVEPVQRVALLRLACGRRRRPRRRGPSRCSPRGSRAGSPASAGGAARPECVFRTASWSPEWTVDRRPPWR